MSRINSILETKAATLVCIAVAIASRIINVFFVSYAGRDKMVLVMQSKSLLEGKGFVIPQYFVANPEAVVYDSTPYWPPGYPLFLAPLLKLFNYNIYNATTALDVIVCIALIFIVRKICKQIGFTRAAINMATIITGCFEYTFIHESLPTDSISLLFLLIGFSFLIKTILNEKPGIAWVFATGFFLFLPNLFRYAYPAVSAGLPVLIIAAGFFLKQKRILRTGAILLITVSVLLALFYFIMQKTAGSSGYILATERGVYPENVVHWYPAIPASFINIAFLSSQLIKHAGVGTGPLLRVLEWVNVISIVLICYGIITYFKSKKFIPANGFDWFLFLGFFCSAFIFLSLGYLSATYKMQIGFAGGWNYIYEPRYFAFVFVFIQLCFTAVLFRYRRLKNVLMRVSAFIAAAVLTVEITHNLYFNTKVAMAFRKYKSAVYREQDYNFFTSLIGNIERENPGADIFAASYKDNFYPYMATYLGHKGLADAIRLNDTLPPVKRKTFLVLMLYTPDIPLFEKFLSARSAVNAGQVDYSHFYLLELNP